MKFELYDTARYKATANQIKKGLQSRGFNVRIKRNKGDYYQYLIYKSVAPYRASRIGETRFPF